MTDNEQPDPIRSQALERLSAQGVRHGFFTRAGGVSQGIYAGLNVGLGSEDDRTQVLENRRRTANWMGVPSEALLTLYQIHSADVVTVEGPLPQDRPKADAMVTDRPGIALGVLTADCGPILFADGDAGIIGAAHAGWKGALGGVLEATIEAMIALGARRERIQASLGPAIGPSNYEVGPEFVVRFVAQRPENERYFAPSGRPGHAMFDLNAYTIDRLVADGVTVDHVERCTYAEPANFYSYRRATHRQEPDYGRQISAIVLEER